MLIDRYYLAKRTKQLLTERQQAESVQEETAEKRFQLKQKFPSWLRKIIFHPFNPAYSIFLQYNERKAKKGRIGFPKMHPFAVDFVNYCLTNQPELETSHYYLAEDEPELIDFIDNRLYSVIAGDIFWTETENRRKIREQQANLRKQTKKKGNGYILSLGKNEYYLSENYFGAHTYLQAYGLKQLPESVKEYIRGKDFLDIGAYVGDTAVFLAKNYAPHKIYAYEPVEEIVVLLQDSIDGNKLNETIEIVPKGVGVKEEEIDIYVNPQLLSSSSINSSIATSQCLKKKIKISTIDNECTGRHVGLIKMDVEGNEFYATTGGLETIKRDKPVLLISLYHSGKDFFEIPPLLKKAVPDYSFRFLNIEILNPIADKILVAYPANLR